MNWDINKIGKQILAVCCVALIAVLQVVFVIPSNADTKAGEQLEVRVQYEGEPGGKIRTLTVFSNSDLEKIGTHKQMFTNITRVGTLMRSAALCVELERVIYAAGIDLDSVESFTFRTTDGYTMTFFADDFIGATGWYYPNLGGLSYRVDSEEGDGALQMKPGALDGGVLDVSAVLALKSYSTKSPSNTVSYDKMKTSASYRFFTGQTDLSYLRYEDEEGNEAFLPTTENDITAWDSVKYIYGVDVVLKGSPPLAGISLKVLGEGMKVGSKHQIEVSFEGDTMGLFKMGDVTWSSSDSSIATVDKNGIVTIKKKGEVTITATAGGFSSSVTIGATEDSRDSHASGSSNRRITGDSRVEKSKDNNQSDKAKAKPEARKVIMAREISLGKEVVSEETETVSAAAAADSQALEAVEPYNKKTVAGSAAAAILACGGGAVFRLRRFRADMGMNIKNKH